MHSTVAGYVLLLASLIALALLLQRGCIRRKKSPFYVLSISDVLSTALTAVLLLATRGEAGIGLSYNWRNGTRGGGGTANRTWTLGEEDALPFPQNYNPRGTADDLDVTVTCDMKDVLTQYGMLLGALTNAFVSVLTFAVQCDLSAACARKACADAGGSPATADARRAVKRVTQKGGTSEGKPSALQRGNVTADNGGGGYVRGIARKILEFEAPRNGDRKSVFFLVTSHWLVPALVVGTLYGAAYDDASVIRRAEDVGCVFQGNFPMSDFYTFSDVDVSTKSVGSVVRVAGEGPLGDVRSSIPGSAEVDEVVSKVRDIVRIALNYTGESVGADSDDATPTLSSTPANSSTLNRSIYFDQEMFHSLLKNMSEDATAFGNPGLVPVGGEDYQEDAQIYFASADEGTTDGLVFGGQNGASVPSNRTRGNTTKRLRAARASAAKPGDGSGHAGRRDPIGNLFFGEHGNLHQYLDAIVRNDSLHMTNKCFVSIDFLRSHLLASFLAVCLSSVLLSCALQARGRRACETTLALASAATDPVPGLPGDSSEDDDCATAVDGSRLSASSRDKKSHADSTEGSDTSHKTRDSRSSGNSTNAQVATSKEGLATQKNNIISEIEGVMKISSNVKLSLILCVILWAPMLLEILLKVLACSRAPRWLTDIAFSSALLFSVLRHAVNMSIIKSQKVRGSTRENRIYPSK